jgi:hypothetical protein
MDDKLAIAKGITKFVVSTCAGSVVSTCAKNLCAPSNPVEKTTLFVGSYALGSMVGERATDWADRKFDELQEAIVSLKNKQKTPA